MAAGPDPPDEAKAEGAGPETVEGHVVLHPKGWETKAPNAMVIYYEDSKGTQYVTVTHAKALRRVADEAIAQLHVRRRDDGISEARARQLRQLERARAKEGK